MKLAATAFLTIALPSSAALAWAPPVQSGPGSQAATVDGGSAAASAARSNATSSATTSASQSSTNTNSVTVVQQATRNIHQKQRVQHWVGNASNDTKVPVASAIAPSSQYAANPCSGSATSIAGQGPMFGLSFGTGGGFDNSCRLGAIGRQDVAFAYLCEVNGDIRKAARLTPRPCPQDRPTPVTPVVHHQVPSSVPEWCYTASGIELVNHPECR